MDDFKEFLDGLATESKAKLDAPSPKKVNSIYAPLGEEAKNPNIAPKKVYGGKRFNAKNLLVEFAKDFPNVYSWVVTKAATGNEFGVSLRDYMIRNGTLSEKQIAAVERAIARDTLATKPPEAPTVDVTRIEEAFHKAVQNGVKVPKMNLGYFRFSLAPAYGKNAGAIYVKGFVKAPEGYGYDDAYLGKIKDGRFFKSRECDEETAAKVLEVASNPHEAAKAYGQRTGNCSCCGRELTNHASIEANIGPICASKYGW